ncbi:uncharacterized protein LOC130986795 isoform X1 [Salvia miltiorrhiza]|uniref:uncharacterized protein LOC130986795 isoform X1 n=1 Tax=Salvia miltiorrhiza TaxID=226208 RepID=UPI0025AD87CE|nr:uncharacterized protein LOC130986795 isoform X1 [Salvia miltiorrhiza]
MFYRYPCIRCKSLSSALKDRFSRCPLFPGKLSVLSSEAEDAAGDFDEEDEVFVSAVMSKYMESKCKRKSAVGIDTLRWALSPQHLLLARKGRRKLGSSGESREGSSSGAGSRLSRCSSATSYDAFFSVKTHFSRSSSLNKIDFQDLSKQSIVIVELLRYQGWPFGLCKRALLLPPLPKSPSDSWSWRKSDRAATVHGR